jgi:Ser/Thr protein kinase RdoA (MazF antagonist)
MTDFVSIAYKDDDLSQPFPCHHSLLSTEMLVARVLTEYQIGSIVECRLLAPRLNDTYIVRTTDNEYILRVYQAQHSTGGTSRTITDILYEIDLLFHLERKGVTVSTPIARKDGVFIQTVLAPEGIRPVVLFSYAPGTLLIPPELTNESSTLYGYALAEIHAATDDFVSPHARVQLDLSFLLDTSLQTIQPVLAHREEDWKYLVQLSHALKNRIVLLPGSALDMGPCHGDAHGSNANITDEQLLTFFDFDGCGYGWRAYDLAGFCWAMAMLKDRPDWTDKKSEDLFMAYVQGYLKRRPLSELNIQSIPIFVAIRHFWFMSLNIETWNYYGWEEKGDDFFDEALTFLQEWTTEYKIAGA